MHKIILVALVPTMTLPRACSFVLPASSVMSKSARTRRFGWNTAVHMSLEPFLSSLSQVFVGLPSTSATITQQIQMAGETSLAGLFALAAVQGALTMHQYNSNPTGGLIVPPGLTIGEEDARMLETKRLSMFEAQTFSMDDALYSRVISDAELEELICDTNDSQVYCSMKKWWHHVTQALIFILPWLASGPIGMGLMRCSHLMHMGVILGLAHLFDFFRKLPNVLNYEQTKEDQLFSSEKPRILVLGDSMAVGIGCCEIFDKEKVFDLPLHKEEHLKVDANSEENLNIKNTSPGPVFPLVLARTLSHRLNKSVAWRSAGVDGGNTDEIGEYLLDVVQEEVDNGKIPDVVVVLTGSNDLKHILGGSATVRGFRSSLMKLANDIRTISPETKVVFPSLPTFQLDRKSILNVFPLSLFLDAIIGFWDGQKRVVADQCPGVLHVDLTVAEVNKWYKEEKKGHEGVSLISADGIHPNAKCYAKWATLVGNKMADLGEGKQEEFANHAVKASRPQQTNKGQPKPALSL